MVFKYIHSSGIYTSFQIYSQKLCCSKQHQWKIIRSLFFIFFRKIMKICQLNCDIGFSMATKHCVRCQKWSTWSISMTNRNVNISFADDLCLSTALTFKHGIHRNKNRTFCISNFSHYGLSHERIYSDKAFWW